MLSMAIGVRPLGVLAMGALASMAGVPFALHLSFGLAVIIVLGLVVTLPALRAHVTGPVG